MQLIKESFGSSKRLLVLLLVACVVLAEVQSSLAQAADSASETSSSAGAKSKSKSASKRVKAPKIRRTIRLVEQPPQVDESVEEAAAEPVEAQPQAPQNIELKNEGPSNHVDVKPSISIGAPTIPRVELPEDEADEQQDKESKLQIVPFEPAAGNKLDQVIGSSNDQVALTMNSGNQQMDLGAHNNNLNSRLLQNSGNTEQLHIDGVGNNKITRISNVGNTEEQHIEHAANRQVAASPQQQQVPAVAAGLPLGPLVQISMNNVEPSKQAAAFGLVAPPSFNLVAPQLDGQLAMWQPSVAQQVPIFNSLVAPQMMAMMMQQQQQPIMPMWLAGPPMTPRDFRRMLRASADGDIHHHHHHHHHHKCQHKRKSASKKANKKKSKKANKKKNKKNKKADKKVEVIEIHHEEPKVEEKPQEEPSKLAELIKPLKVIVEPTTTTTTTTTTPAPPEAEEDEEEEIVEWETVRVPKTRKVLKSARKLAN